MYEKFPNDENVKNELLIQYQFMNIYLYFEEDINDSEKDCSR